MIKLMICDTSELVFPYHRYGNTGRVHSIFSHSFNISVEQDLIHVSGRPDFLSSFGIGICPADMELVQERIGVGDLVVLKERTIVLYGKQGLVSLSGSETELKKMELTPLSYGKKERLCLLKRLYSFLEKEELGLTSKSDVEQAEKLLTGSFKDESSLEQAFSFLLGRGLGLTPSGDDILMGYLFGMALWTNQPILEAIAFYKEKISRRTTVVSRAYLLALLEKRVSSPIFSFHQALLAGSADRIEKDLYRIREIGHTSGVDFLFGVYLSLQKIYMDNEI